MKDFSSSQEEIIFSLEKDGEYYFMSNDKKYLLYKWEQCDGCLLLLTEAGNLNGEIIWQSESNNISDGTEEFLNYILN